MELRYRLPARCISIFAAGAFAAGLGVATCLSYLLAYTPLKKRTVWATFVGAFPGAIPPMIGWVAASAGSISARGCCSRFFSSGNSRTFTPLRGCIAKIMRVPDSDASGGRP